MRKNSQAFREGRPPVNISVNVMLEGWGDNEAPGLGPMGNPLRAGVLDLQARSWAAYGPKEGAWRLLDLLAARNVKASFYTSGIVAERYPDLLREIANAGHDVCGHSWTQNTLPAYLDGEAELADIQRCTQVIEAASGKAPRGWISPRCTPSAVTSELLAKSGYQWHADIFDADLPYSMQFGEHRIVALPFTMEINDLPMSVRYGNEPSAFAASVRHTLSNWHRIGSPETCVDVTVHAHVYGRPAGAIALDEALEFIASCPEIASYTSHSELADIEASRER
ncbi:polysaccharide deacetylase family protein [Burkholderia multivorans]|uniref:polysaccharide deacetylase family protein n=1 Tax=Burkholderia multivorans TaxID=87883 RepID=UPI00209CE085|nr:polysaccharide deacetylase family protein [Burkholderia multivorans]MCO8591154.1 polysaccharide deacetylase family protein [Burkholderia multivorans]MCO8612092.1 polysaccharide deacetylase family protein [Burkholderia multivorans]MCO8632888.1 polysaccharide deacetylase family protein [Burkholderia multivorans]MCO8638437.1 polysaccharide deacetylase family protein [Burkholderia multivorans]MCO8646437.1 polysaccharide deacetylase family protein [Burkholderia multivorans]